MQILRDQGPLALFEVASILGLFDHQISGRFTELEKDGLIVKTGQRRRKPETDCDAEVWTIRELDDASAGVQVQDLGELQGYPLTLVAGDVKGSSNVFPSSLGKARPAFRTPARAMLHSRG